VSAALMDKLRERDEEVRAPADGAPQSSDTLQDFSMPPAQDSDPTSRTGARPTIGSAS